MNRYADARNAASQARENARNPQQKEEVQRFFAFLQAAQSNAGNNLAAPDDEGAGDNLRTYVRVKKRRKQLPPDAHDSGNLQEATGRVTELSCMNGLKMKVETAAGPLTLALIPARNCGFGWRSKPSGPFNPCTALKGQRVTVEYESKDASAKTGSLQSVTVLAAAAGDAAGAPDLPAARRLGGETSSHETVSASADGTVEQVSCNGNEMMLKLDAGEAAFTLHARDASRVPVEQDVAFDAGDFTICSQLQGHSAKVTFVVADGKTYDGEIQSVEVLK